MGDRGNALSDKSGVEAENLRKEHEELKIMYETVVKHATSLENDLEKKLREITIMSITDSLTGIYNRRKFTESLFHEVENAKKHGTILSLIMFDVDFFKEVNDTFGHDYGDIVLVSLTGIIRKILLLNSIFARWGGDEFAILLPDVDIDAAIRLAETSRQEIHRYFSNNRKEVSCSFGVSSLLPEDDVKSFLVRADNALYEAKKCGRNSVRKAL